MKHLFLVLALALCPHAAAAACAGSNLLETLEGDQLAEINAAVEASPYPRGNHWRATRGDSVIDVFGTFHAYDPRFEDVMKRIAPFIETAAAVYAEATEEELGQLQSEMSRNPALFMIGPGEPTLPERLPEAEWQRLKDELSARGLPPFIASKFQSWYVMMMLGIPPCAMTDLASGAEGLDKMILERADAAGVPTEALEPYDTLFRVFGTLKDEDDLGLIRAAIAMTDRSEDMYHTLTESYFSQDHRAIWELSRVVGRNIPGLTAEQADADFAKMEEILLTSRNRAWIDVILPAAEGRRIVVAVGAAHLSGRDGVLNLLAQKGYALEPAPF